MSVTYNKINQIIGSLLFLKNNHDVQFGEFVKIITNTGEERNGQIIRMDEEVLVLEVFQDTTGISSENSDIAFTGDLFKVKLSKDMMGGTFNSLGKPINIYTKKTLDSDIISGVEREINGSPINPFAREYPTEIIQTGISVIDGLNTLIRGQKLPIFSGQGLSHNNLAAQIVTQARVLTNEPFLVIFCGIGLLQDEAVFFLDKFKESGNINNILSFFNFIDDPVMERLIIPRVALTAAEYFAFEKDMHVLIILINMTNYAEALRELSSAREEIPSRKGYPGYLYSDLASIYERTGKIKGKKGSITQIPILTMPNDDITHPIADTSGYITEGQIVLNRSMHKSGIYPPIELLASLSRLMKDAIGEKTTRADHADVASQLLASYSESLDVKELISIVGEDSLNQYQTSLLNFNREFEAKFINQEETENRSFEDTLNIAWKVLANIRKENLYRIHDEFVKKYYPG
ncbi:MAG: V-type ATP synthase subunit B [Promethearchaeota archaeon]